MENIIINFTANPDGLQPGIDGLEQLTFADKQVEAQFKKTAAEIAKHDNVLSQGVKIVKKDVEGLAFAFGNLSKSAAGGISSKALDDLRKNLKGTGDEFKQLNLVLDVAKKKLQDLKPNSAEWKQLNTLVGEGEQVLRKFGDQEVVTAGKTKRLSAELREMKDQIARRVASGESGADIDALIQKAGQLDDALKDVNAQITRTGSDTRTIEGTVQIIGTAVQATAGLAAAQEFLGDENEEFNKVLAKMNALLVISNSVQAIQTALQKESAATLLVENALKRISALNTTLQAGAESSYTVVRYGAIAAQKALNAVMALSPSTWLLVAIGALAGVVLLFSNRTDDATEAQRKLNDEMEAGIAFNEEYNKFIQRRNDIELERLKLQGASEKQLREKKLSDVQAELAIEQQREEKLRAVYTKAIADRDEFNKQLETTDKKRLAGALAGGSDINKAQLEEASRTIKIYEGIYAKREELKDKVALLDLQNKNADKEDLEKSNDDLEAAAEKSKAAREKRLADQKAFAEKERKAIAEISKLSLEDQVKREQEIVNNDGNVNSRLNALSRLSEVKKRILFEEQRFELGNTELTGKQRELIAAQYLSRLNDLERETAKERVNIINENGQRIIQADKEAADKRKAAKDQQDKELFDEITSKSGGRIGELEIELRSNDLILSSAKTNFAEKLRLRMENAEALAAIARQENIEATRLFGSHLISYQEFLNRMAKAKDDADKAEMEKEMTKEEKRAAIRERSEQILNGLVQIGINLNNKRFEEELRHNQELFDKKFITEAEYNSKIRQVKRQQAQQDRQKAIFDILIATAKNIVEVFPNVLLMGLAGALGLTQTGAVLSAELPKYKRGKIGIDGPGTETSDSILARISKNESVINASMSGKHRAALEAINNDKFQQYLNKHEMLKFYEQFNLPEIPANIEKHIDVINRQAPIDYDKLGQVVAQKLGQAMKDHPVFKLDIDQDGFNASIQKGLETINYKNKKLLM
ncbi:MAG: hypothetical protein WKF97_08400 [Chitinophagaceae bacterium]